MPIRIKSFRMRSATLALCALAIGTTPMWSQETAPPPPPSQSDSPPPPHERPTREQMQERQIEHLTRHLSLTTDQAAQVRAIFKDADTQMESLHQDTSTPREQKWEKMKSIHEAAQTKIRSILTDEQKPKFDEMVARQHEHMENHEGRPGAPPAPPSTPPAS